MEKALARPQAAQRQALVAAGGDNGKALDRLLENTADPDCAQALFEALRDLAPQNGGDGKTPEAVSGLSLPSNSRISTKPAPGEASEPLFKVKPGELGIAHVARIAGNLGARLATGKVNPLDLIILEDSIRLMAIHGAPSGPAQTVVPIVGGDQKTSSIDPVVKGTLRSLFKSGEPFLAAQACRALGRLGDAETAEDLIKNPKNYPGASIAHFGADQVEIWKQNRLKLLRRGRGTDEASYWQSARLTPQHMDVAIDLARAGDAGAGMSVERNMAIEAMQSSDPDGRMARYIDIRLRFPGTREAWKAEAAMGGLDALEGILGLAMYPKTREVFLRGLDHDFKIVFGQDPSWKPKDLVILNGWSCYPVALIHHKIHDPKDWEREKFGSFLAEIEVLFRKYYKKTIIYQATWENSGHMDSISMELSLFARHLGMQAIDYPGRQGDIQCRLYMQKRDISDSLGRNDQQWWISRAPSECINLGHIKSMEDF